MAGDAPPNIEQELRTLAQLRAVAQEQITKSVVTSASFAKGMWGIFVSILAATVWLTTWMNGVNTGIEQLNQQAKRDNANMERRLDDNSRRIRTMWLKTYGVEP